MFIRAFIVAIVVTSTPLVACNGDDGDGGAGASGWQGGGDETPWAFTSDAPEHRPAGDQSVFADIDVVVRVVDLEHVLYDGKPSIDWTTGPNPEVSVHLAMLSLVEINGGLAERRVAGLQVFANGEEAPEVGNAGTPQQFTFQHQVRDPMRDTRTLMEIRYQGASFAIGAVPLEEVDFTSPAAGQVVSGDQLIVRWTGVDEEPDSLFAGCGGEEWPSSPIANHQVTVTLGEPHVDATTHIRCTPAVSADWRVRSPGLPGTPFRSFRVERSTRRIRLFEVE